MFSPYSCVRSGILEARIRRHVVLTCLVERFVFRRIESFLVTQIEQAPTSKATFFIPE